MKSLRRLDLSNNQLKSLPNSFFDLRSLKTHNLEKNPLGRVPESIGKLTSLEKLDLCLNKLTMIPSSMIQLKALQEANLELNPITDNKAMFMLEEMKSRGKKVITSSEDYYRSLDRGSALEPCCPECGGGNIETDHLNYWYCPDCDLSVTKG